MVNAHLSKSSSHDLSDDDVRARAYAIYERRGRVPGNPDDDWTQALLELRAERASSERRGRSAGRP